MKNIFCRQVVLGIIGIALSVGAFIAIVTSFNVLNKWLGLGLFAIVSGCVFGCLLYIFGGRDLFFYGAKYGFGIVAFIALAKGLPGIWRGLFIVVCALAAIAVPVVNEYLIDREKNSSSPKIKRLARKLKEEEELEEVMKITNEEFLSSIAFGEKSLLLRTSKGGLYQCIKGENKLYFVYIGGEISGIDPDYMKTDFSDEERFIDKKKDYAIVKSDINSITYKTDKKDSPFENSGSLVIEFKGMKKRFQILDTVSKETVKAFFEGMKLIVKAKPDKHMQDNLLESNVKKGHNKVLISRLKLIVTILTFASVMVSAVFLFLNFNYRVMSLLSMVLFISTFALYVKYDDILSMVDEKNQSTFSKGKINILFTILAPCFGLGMRSLLDFNLTSYKNFWILSMILFSVILFIFFRFTSEYKIKKSPIFSIILVSIFFAPSTVAQVNCAFDYSKAKVVQSEISDMRISKSSKGPDEYYLEVTISSGKKMELDVSREYYNKLKVGDTVRIGEKEGLLKIPYAFVYEEE